WFDNAAAALLYEADWPGNVRQLENLVRRLVAMEPSGAVPAAVVQRELAYYRQRESEEEAIELDAVERQQILKVLKQAGGNKTKAAEILGIQRRTLYKKLARMEKDADAE
ncbi:MAG: helix-turn-helix domain-containing protein, partial [Terrimicrobiaceae bacterium]|nr:helix-turn-helix domain-containing protein [Terrimicrobiaceae bacterium]